MSLITRSSLPEEEKQDTKHGLAGLILAIISLVIVLALGITEIVTSTKREDTIQTALNTDIQNLTDRIFRLENELNDLRAPPNPTQDKNPDNKFSK